MYKIIQIELSSGIVYSLHRLADNAYIPLASDNTDYQNFKAQINADEAQLEDADGNLMTDAKEFVATLP